MRSAGNEIPSTVYAVEQDVEPLEFDTEMERDGICESWSGMLGLTGDELDGIVQAVKEEQMEEVVVIVDSDAEDDRAPGGTEVHSGEEQEDDSDDDSGDDKLYVSKKRNYANYSPAERSALRSNGRLNCGRVMKNWKQWFMNRRSKRRLRKA